jgi:hypothetical protein
LDLLLLVIPLVVLGAAYFLISQTLWQSMDTEKQMVKQTSGTICGIHSVSQLTNKVSFLLLVMFSAE